MNEFNEFFIQRTNKTQQLLIWYVDYHRITFVYLDFTYFPTWIKLYLWILCTYIIIENDWITLFLFTYRITFRHGTRLNDFFWLWTCTERRIYNFVILLAKNNSRLLPYSTCNGTLDGTQMIIIYGEWFLVFDYD